MQCNERRLSILLIPGDEICDVKVIDFGNAIQNVLSEKKLYFGDFQLQVRARYNV